MALSSNDGCVVARSNEAKALGIPMGAPAFKWRAFFRQHGVVAFSGNFELYGDMSRRITSILTSITPHIEIYSVDESFLDLSELQITDYTAWAKTVRAKVLQWTGLPVSIGIAPSKTLAKLAAERGKKQPELGGVLDLYSLNQTGRLEYLQKVAVQDVWGIGWRLTPRLKAENIKTAADVSKLRPQLAQSWMGIRGRQLVAELGGESCFSLQKLSKPAKSIANTRTFGEDTNQLHVLESALSSFVARTAHSLRASRQLTKKAGFFIATNRHKPGYKMTSQEITLPHPTADTGYITELLLQKMAAAFNPRAEYHRAGVWLKDFIPEHALQTDLLGSLDPKSYDRGARRMHALDSINKRYGKHSAFYASENLGNSWQPKRNIQTPRYTTQWQELPKVTPIE